jgi:hypothetical protein
VSQFAQVKKGKDRSRSKVKDTSASHDGAPSHRGGARVARGGDSVRGGRARGTDRGRGGFRGGARGGAAANGTRPTGTPSIPTTESPAWDIPEVSTEPKEDAPAAIEEPTAPAQTHKAETPKAAAAVPEGKKTWASMFAKPKPAPAPPKSAVQPAVAQEQAPPHAETPAQEEPQEAAPEPELPEEPIADESVSEPQAIEADLTPDIQEPGPELTLTPSKDELTKDNVEHLPDESQPPPTETAASTVAGSADIGSIAGVATPLSTTTQAPIGRPAVGGYATTALKATGAHRNASFQRRLVEQHEAVVMPGNHAVDRAAVQFGSLGLNGDLDDDSLDVDEDREEAETRTQPPQHSPVQPRASLPPAPRQAAPQADAQPQETNPTPKNAPGLPIPSQQQQLSHQAQSNPLGPQAMQSQGSQGNQSYNQFGRYGQTGIQSESAAPQQKPYDPFGQQVPQSSQYDYPNQQQGQNAAQQPQSQAPGFSSAPDSFSSQYLTSDQQRSAYQNYYQSYGQQNAQTQQEAGSAQQRTGSAFGAGPTDSTYSQGQQAQGRYNEAQNSGHNTPNPALPGQHPSGPASQQGQQLQQPHAQQGQQVGGYPYNHPYYGTPYYAAYMNQYGNYGQQQGGYGGFGGKGGMYGQPHHYGMSPQASFDQHSASPANAGGFGQSHGRDSALGGGLGEYGRSVSSASHTQPTATAAGGFGGAFPDTFGRSQGGYPNQNSSYGQQGGQQGADEGSLKPFGAEKSGGPSPSALGTQPGRPGSATNTPGAGQGPQSHQQGFGGYPGHLNQGQGNQYGGLGGLGHQGAGSHQAGGYGGQYGGFGGGGYGSYNRGGWGTNYGQQQQH